MNRPTKNIRQAIATILMLTVGSFSNLLLTSATAQIPAMKFKGELAAIRGAVTLNGFAVKTGAVLFNESRIETGENASATIDLGQQGQLVLGPNSVFVLETDAANVSGNLRNGSITTHMAAGVSANVTTTDTTASTNGAMTVDVNCGSTRVAASTSDVKVTGAGKTEVVAAGKETTVGSPQNNSRCPRMAIAGGGVAGAAAGGTISGGVLAALLIVGIGTTIATIVAVTESDNLSGNIVSPIR